MKRLVPAAVARLWDTRRRIRLVSRHAPGKNARALAGMWVARLITPSWPAAVRRAVAGDGVVITLATHIPASARADCRGVEQIQLDGGRTRALERSTLVKP